jgi:hypothetical protein
VKVCHGVNTWKSFRRSAREQRVAHEERAQHLEHELPPCAQRGPIDSVTARSVTGGRLPAFGRPCSPARHSWRAQISRLVQFFPDAAATRTIYPCVDHREWLRLASSLLGSGLVGVECAAKGGRAVIASRRLAKDSVLACGAATWCASRS